MANLKFTGVAWNPAFIVHKRTGVFGWLLDKIFGTRKTVNPNGNKFFTVSNDGNVLSSSDGIYWTHEITMEQGPDGE